MQSKIHDWLSKDYECKYQEYETHLFYSLPLLYHTKTVHLHYKEYTRLKKGSKTNKI